MVYNFFRKKIVLTKKASRDIEMLFFSSGSVIGYSLQGGVIPFDLA